MSDTCISFIKIESDRGKPIFVFAEHKSSQAFVMKKWRIRWKCTLVFGFLTDESCTGS